MITNQYEVVFIINTGLGEDGITATIEKFKNLIASNGTIDSIEEWGKRRLAYPINDMTEGYYVLMNITCPADLPAELDRIFKITEGVLRSLIVIKEIPKISPKTQAKILAREQAKEQAKT
jgi:small subunit ribosomal protein S6